MFDALHMELSYSLWLGLQWYLILWTPNFQWKHPWLILSHLLCKILRYPVVEAQRVTDLLAEQYAVAVCQRAKEVVTELQQSSPLDTNLLRSLTQYKCSKSIWFAVFMWSPSFIKVMLVTLQATYQGQTGVFGWSPVADQWASSGTAAGTHTRHGSSASVYCTAWRLQPQACPSRLLHIQARQSIYYIQPLYIKYCISVSEITLHARD